MNFTGKSRSYFGWDISLRASARKAVTPMSAWLREEGVKGLVMVSEFWGEQIQFMVDLGHDLLNQMVWLEVTFHYMHLRRI